MTVHNNTLSNTRLLSLIVIVSVIALAFVLNGGNQIDQQQQGIINIKPATTTIPVTPDTLVLAI